MSIKLIKGQLVKVDLYWNFISGADAVHPMGGGYSKSLVGFSNSALHTEGQWQHILSVAFIATNGAVRKFKAESISCILHPSSNTIIDLSDSES